LNFPVGMRRRWRTPAGSSAIARCVSRWWTLAQLLRQRGVKPGDSVAVALPRSVFLTLALHGIVEAGAAWLPLDTGYPDDRLRMMLEDARPSLLIATEDQLARFSDIPGLESLCYQQPLRRG
ncbi:hypothetical protein CJ430_28550, partial [Klebsiella pneumoniae]